jgi:hypothetical protein
MKKYQKFKIGKFKDSLNRSYYGVYKIWEDGIKQNIMLGLTFKEAQNFIKVLDNTYNKPLRNSQELSF